MVSTVWSVSCLLFFYSRCAPCPAICKSEGHVPPCPMESAPLETTMLDISYEKSRLYTRTIYSFATAPAAVFRGQIQTWESSLTTIRISLTRCRCSSRTLYPVLEISPFWTQTSTTLWIPRGDQPAAVSHIQKTCYIQLLSCSILWLNSIGTQDVSEDNSLFKFVVFVMLDNVLSLSSQFTDLSASLNSTKKKHCIQSQSRFIHVLFKLRHYCLQQMSVFHSLHYHMFNIFIGDWRLTVFIMLLSLLIITVIIIIIIIIITIIIIIIIIVYCV